MKKILYFSFFFLLATHTYSQVVWKNYRKVPVDLVDNIDFYDSIKFSNNFYFLENALPKNHSKNGDSDYTEIVQKVLNNRNNIIFPNFPILINDKGLYLNSNSTIYFQKNSKIVTKPSNSPKTDFENRKEWYDILRIYDKENINLYNLQIEGDRKKHVGTEGEWGAAIGIRNSKNIKVCNAKISNTWGDGIFIGSENGGFCNNVHLENIWIDFARRNGLALTSGVNIKLINMLISNTQGTLPMCGIDIEPSVFQEKIENIYLENIYTFNNANSGLNINLNAFSENKNKSKNVIIKIINHTDLNSEFGFSYSINVNNSTNDPKGFIKIKNAKWINPRRDFYWKTNNKKSIKIDVESVQYIKNNRNISRQIN